VRLSLAGDIDLTNCDREPIHIPGAILPHGAMLVLDPESLEILQAAGDCKGLVGATAQELLGRCADTLFEPIRSNASGRWPRPLDLKKPRHLLDPCCASEPIFRSMSACTAAAALSCWNSKPPTRLTGLRPIRWQRFRK
jgi:hypothetical protein